MNTNNEKITIEQILQGLDYAKTTLNFITVSGVDNCQKLSMVYNNIDIFLKLLKQGKMSIIENVSEKDNL